MIAKNRGLLSLTTHVCLAGFLFICLVSILGTVGCSDSGGGGSKTGYHLTGYDGIVNDSSSGQQSITSAVGNSGLDFYSEFPWFVNLTFQVFDEESWGVSDLTVNNFQVIEDSAEVSQDVSEMNLRRRDFLPSEYTYALKTVLFVDNTPSTSLNLEKMIEAAQVVVDDIDQKQQQEIAIVAYDEAGDFVVIQDFTSNVITLSTKLTGLQPSYGSTDFYGAVIDSLSLWEDNPSPAATEPSPATTKFVQGFLVAITDGLDTSNLNDLADARAAGGDKQVITVAVGSDIPSSVLNDLEQLGNGGFYPVPNPNQNPDADQGDKPEDENLCEWMLVVQNRMIAYADAFYWLQYISDSETTSTDQNLEHSVVLSVVNNGNVGNDADISGTFSSEEFFAGTADIYFNSTGADPDGVTEEVLSVEKGQAAGDVTSPVTALTYSRVSNNPGQYTWSSSNQNVVTVEADSKDSSKAVITAVAPGTTTIIVTDTANNNVQQALSVNVKIKEDSFEMIKHVIESKRPWFADATFQVRKTESENNQWEWVTDLTREDFTVMENGALIDFENSEVNLRKRDLLPSDYSYTLKTVLLIDNTPSGTTNLDLIKQAAKTFVSRAFVNDPMDNTDFGPLLGKNNIKQQQIAIFSFDRYGDKLFVQDFTSDVVTLNTAIDSIEEGFGLTDIYGGMIDSLNLWTNKQAPYSDNNELQQGVLVVLSDGWQSFGGFLDADAVIFQIGDKQVITVGVGDDLISAGGGDLIAFGNAGFYSVPNPEYDNDAATLLQTTLMGIQDELLDFSNSFYWLNYKSYLSPSPECNKSESLKITINNNSNDKAGGSTTGFFESCAFFEGIDGEIYVNSTVTNPWGETETINLYYVYFNGVDLDVDIRYPLEAFTYNHENIPNYEWISGKPNLVTIDVDESSYAFSKAKLVLPENKIPGTATIKVTDKENNIDRNLTIKIQRIELRPVAYYPFNGNANDESGNGHDGDVIGAVLTNDRFGSAQSAYSFNGTSDYIALDMFYGNGDGSVSNTIDAITVGAWVKFSSTDSGTIISFGDNYWTLYANLTPRIDLNPLGWNTYDINTGIAGMIGNDYNDNQWHFVCATYEAGATVNNKKLYVDGLLIKQASAHSGNPLGNGAISYGFIGKKDNLSNLYSFQGILDDLFIFDMALDSDQVQQFYLNEKD